jgi:hypothetical protein
MSAIEIIATAARSMGYRDEAVVRNYTFADVLDPADSTRTVLLAAFTQTPPSYRSAALAAVMGGKGDTMELVKAHRALGAPLLFVIEDDLISLWQVRGDAPPRVIERLSTDNLPALFERHQAIWAPDAIHRAKSIGAIDIYDDWSYVEVPEHYKNLILKRMARTQIRNRIAGFRPDPDAVIEVPPSEPSPSAPKKQKPFAPSAKPVASPRPETKPAFKPAPFKGDTRKGSPFPTSEKPPFKKSKPASGSTSKPAKPGKSASSKGEKTGRWDDMASLFGHDQPRKRKKK